MNRWFLAGFPAAALIVLGACSQSTPQQPVAQQPAPAATAQEHKDSAAHDDAGEEMMGYAISLSPTKGSKTTGTVMLMNMGDGVHFSGVIGGLTPGPHAIHIHEKGDCSAPDAASAGAHFNPASANHGAPDKTPHHAGDLGNIIAGNDGRAEINVHASGLSMSGGANAVQGRAFIIHAGPDDFKTQPSGNSGERVACAVIQGAN